MRSRVSVVSPKKAIAVWLLLGFTAGLMVWSGAAATSRLLQGELAQLGAAVTPTTPAR